MMLNILMSFAQFEREMTADRIRDKIYASKKRGMWTGGPTPWYTPSSPPVCKSGGGPSEPPKSDL